MNAIETINKIKEVARNNKDRISSQKTREVTKDIKCFRQGALYVFRVSDDWDVGEVVKRDKIADGVSLGSTHILMGEFTVYAGVKVPDCISDLHSRVCTGYAFDVGDNAVLTHQEHDHFCFVDGGRFQVCHQVDMRTLQRAID